MKRIKFKGDSDLAKGLVKERIYNVLRIDKCDCGTKDCKMLMPVVLTEEEKGELPLLPNEYECVE